MRYSAISVNSNDNYSQAFANISRNFRKIHNRNKLSKSCLRTSDDNNWWVFSDMRRARTQNTYSCTTLEYSEKFLLFRAHSLLYMDFCHYGYSTLNEYITLVSVSYNLTSCGYSECKLCWVPMESRLLAVTLPLHDPNALYALIRDLSVCLSVCVSLSPCDSVYSHRRNSR